MKKTITLTGEETVVKLDKAYPYIWVRNFGESDIYMSVKPGIIPDADGVTVIPAGGGANTGDENQTDVIYLSGSGKVEVRPQFNAFCPFFKLAKKGGESFDYGVNFGTHNILADYGVNTTICEKIQNGETVTYKIFGNLATNWHMIACLFPLSVRKMYKLSVKNFNGYGRLAISAYGDGRYVPYEYENKNVVGSSSGSDNFLISADNTNPKYFYICPQTAHSLNDIKCGIWICTDYLRDVYGAAEHSFEIGLYEEIGGKDSENAAYI